MLRKTIGIMAVVMWASNAVAAPNSDTLLCVATDVPQRMYQFEAGDKFIIAYRYEGTVAISMIYPRGGSHEYPCTVNGSYLICPFFEDRSMIFNKETLKLEMPVVIGPQNSTSSCQPLDISNLPLK